MGTGKLWGSEKGVFKEGRIAGEFDAAGAGGSHTAGLCLPLGSRVPDGILRLDLIDCCVVLGKCLAFSGPPFS